ncbi:hypothetical protein ABN214_15940 [Proteus terrae]|uniref:hypothetical protein n=1 Tax=Proteus terrae TaxID=1574161 RepID=UPI0032DA0628
MIYIAIDLDDTMVDTLPEMHDELTELTGKEFPKDTFLTPESTGGALTTILNSGHFMATAKPNPVFMSELKRAKASLAKSFNVMFGICTHRGYHKDAEALTKPMLDNCGFDFEFTHYLDPAKNHDKMDYLLSIYNKPGDIVILVDDRPTNGVKGEFNFNVLLMTRPWNEGVMAPKLNRVNNVIELHDLLVGLVTRRVAGQMVSEEIAS